MRKSEIIVGCSLTLLTISAGVFFALVPAKTPPGTRVSPLSEVTAFEFVAVRSTYREYDEPGRLIDTTTGPPDQPPLRIFLLGPSRALLRGNVGSAELAVFRSAGSASFVETTPTGNRHVLVVYQKLAHEGFPAVHDREVTALGGTLRSEHVGYARPLHRE